jgi:hypothetical protein
MGKFLVRAAEVLDGLREENAQDCFQWKRFSSGGGLSFRELHNALLIQGPDLAFNDRMH